MSTCIKMLQNVSAVIKKLSLLSLIVLFSGLFLVDGVEAVPVITEWFNNVTQNNASVFTANETDSILFNITVSETVSYSWYSNGSLVGENQNIWTWNTDSATDGFWNITVVVNNDNGSDSQEWTLTVTEEIQKLINDLSTSGGTVTLEGRTYYTNTTIYLNKSNVEIRGLNSSTKIIHGQPSSSSLSKIFLVNSSVDLTNITFRDITFEVGFTGNGPNVIRFYNTSNIVLRELNVTGTWNNRFDKIIFNNQGGGQPWQSWNATIINNTFELMRGGVQLSYITNVTFANNTVSVMSSTPGLDLNSLSRNVTVGNNTFRDATFTIYGASGTTIVQGNILYSSWNAGLPYFIEINSDGGELLIENNRLYDADLSEPVNMGIKYFPMYNNHKDTIIRNNRIYDVTEGIRIYGTYDVFLDGKVNITNNVFFNISQDAFRIEDQNWIINLKNNIFLNVTGTAIDDSSPDSNVTSMYNLFWNNTLTYSQDVLDKTGDIYVDPLFANPAAYDFHLRSSAEWWNGTVWIVDSVHSPAIDTGDPSSDYSNEPSYPKGRINLGAYGNTIYASKSVQDTEPPDIDFFPPTPDDGEPVGGDYIFVGVNLSEAADWIVLEWNGTNESMQGLSTGTSRYRNMTGLINGQYSFKVWANDSAGNMNVSETRSVTVNYTSLIDSAPPSITFIDSGGITVDENYVYVNVSISDESGITSFIDWNRSLASYWRFEDAGGTAGDSSTYENNGTIYGAVSSGGKFGNALNFDGINDYVEIENPDLNLTDEVTIEAWVKPVLGSRGAVAARYVYNDSMVNDRSFVLSISSGGNVEFALSSNGTGTTWLTSNGAVSDGAWNHVVAASDGTTMRIYINGVLDSTTAPAPSVIYSPDRPIQIGAWIYGVANETDNEYFNGAIDEVKIHRRALSPQEINASYDSKLYGLERNFTSLDNGSYTYYACAQNTAGNYNCTETRVSQLLSKGRNIVNYIGDSNTPIWSSLSSVDYAIIWDESGAEGSYTKWVGGEFDNLTFGREYRIHAWSNTTWTYPVP